MPRSRAGTLQEAPIEVPTPILTRARTRRIVQLVSLATFAIATVAGLGVRSGGWIPDNLYSRLDPLVGLAAIIASRAWIGFGAAALLTFALTVVFGRAWCGWLCPVGALLDLAPARDVERAPKLARHWRLGKYAALALVLGAALLGNLAPMVLDPITIITRPLQELARPYFGADSVGRAVGVTIARDSVRAVALLSLLPLLGVLALNGVSRRTWCRSLCPLGALLALVSKAPGIRRVVDTEACSSCGGCARVCPTAAIEPAAGFASSSAECTVCMRCEEQCPQQAITFRRDPARFLEPAFRPDRRDAVVTLGATGVSLAATMLPIRQFSDDLILRPCATDDRRLAQLCIRCGACYSACPTGALRPSLSITNEAGPWTPMLDVRPAHCTLNCNRCGRVCPTDAIHTPTREERVALGLGAVAVVDRNRCRAWRGRECMRCQRICPISGAIVGVDRATEFGGASVTAPVVVRKECVGCNLCRGVCPVMPPAIGVPEGPPPVEL